MTTHITPEMEKAGYEAIKKLADMHGEGWALRMVSQKDIYAAMEYIYDAMRTLEPDMQAGPHPIKPPIAAK